MKNICKHCKFCRIENGKLYMWKQKTSFGSFMQLDIDDKIKYFCKFMPKEIETTPENWCSQFKDKN